jgi:hypothetical protein
MNPVLLVHAFMTAFLIPFRHKMDAGSFGIGASRIIYGGAIRRNRTYALAIYKPDVTVPVFLLEIDCSGASNLFERSLYRPASDSLQASFLGGHLPGNGYFSPTSLATPCHGTMGSTRRLLLDLAPVHLLYYSFPPTVLPHISNYYR